MGEFNIILGGMAFQKGDRRIISSWAWFDWANSVYPLVITTAVFPLYYGSVIISDSNCIPDCETGQLCEQYATIFGRKFINTELYAYSISFSFLLISFLLPLLSGIADYAGRKKFFMQVFSTIGAISSGALFFFTGPENLEFGLSFAVLASIGFAGSIVFYNAFLPEIAHEKDLDRVSAQGFTMGYIGSSILLTICLVLIIWNDSFGIDKGLATRISFLLAGIWWFGFAFMTWRYLPGNIYNHKVERKGLLTKGWRELLKVLKIIRQKESLRLRLFLLAFFFYSLGYMTVIYLATPFGQKELCLGTTELITCVMLIQFVAIGGSYFFAWMAGKIGNIQSIMMSVLIWTLLCILTWYVETALHFYLLALGVGTVMGGIQTLSRSTYAKLLPPTKDHASFYSFYDITEKVAITVGAYCFGLIESVTGSMRGSALFLSVFFGTGLLILFLVTRIKSPEEATSI